MGGGGCADGDRRTEMLVESSSRSAALVFVRFQNTSNCHRNALDILLEVKPYIDKLPTFSLARLKILNSTSLPYKLAKLPSCSRTVGTALFIFNKRYWKVLIPSEFSYFLFFASYRTTGRSQNIRMINYNTELSCWPNSRPVLDHYLCIHLNSIKR